MHSGDRSLAGRYSICLAPVVQEQILADPKPGLPGYVAQSVSFPASEKQMDAIFHLVELFHPKLNKMIDTTLNILFNTYMQNGRRQKPRAGHLPSKYAACGLMMQRTNHRLPPLHPIFRPRPPSPVIRGPVQLEKHLTGRVFLVIWQRRYGTYRPMDHRLFSRLSGLFWRPNRSGAFCVARTT